MLMTPAFRLDHLRQRGAHDPHRCAHIDRIDTVPHSVLDGEHVGEGHEARIVDQHVYATAQVQRRLDQPVRRVVGRNVAGNSGDLPADRLDLAGANLKVLRAALGQNHVAPGIGERLGQSEADPLTGAGDDAAVAAQVEEVPGYVGDWEGHRVSFSMSAGTHRRRFQAGIRRAAE